MLAKCFAGNIYMSMRVPAMFEFHDCLFRNHDVGLVYSGNNLYGTIAFVDCIFAGHWQDSRDAATLELRCLAGAVLGLRGCRFAYGIGGMDIIGFEQVLGSFRTVSYFAVVQFSVSWCRGSVLRLRGVL
jgi:hypothetical protein